jgi:hypothetical protein
MGEGTGEELGSHNGLEYPSTLPFLPCLRSPQQDHIVVCLCHPYYLFPAIYHITMNRYLRREKIFASQRCPRSQQNHVSRTIRVRQSILLRF